MFKFASKHPFKASILINTCLFLLFYTIVFSRYGTTDDVEMQMILSGKAVIDAPYPFLRYTHVFIGYILSSLYRLFPSFPCYGTYLCLAHFVGMTSILYCILRIQASSYRLIFYIFGFLLGETLLLQELQFTSASIVLGTGAIFLGYTAFTLQSRTNIKLLASSILLLLISSMIRYESLQLCLILGMPLYLLAVINSKKWLSVMVHVVLVYGACLLLNNLHYKILDKDPQWKQFNQFKKSLAAHNILDYHQSQYLWSENTADDYFYTIGWEYEDYQLFRHWFMADSSTYGLKQFEAIEARFADCPLPQEHLYERSWNFWVEMPLNDYIFNALIFLFFSLVLLPFNRWVFFTIISTAALVLSILYALFLIKHLPDRVSFPMAFYMIALCSLLIQSKSSDLKNQLFSFVFIGFLCLSSFKALLQKSSDTATQKKYWSAALDSLNAQPDQLYIGGGDFYMQAILTPFDNSKDSLIDNFNMLDFGHLSNAPVHYLQLERFNIDNIHTQAVKDSSIFLVHRHNAPILQWYAHYMHRKYDMHIEYKLVRKEEAVDIAVYSIQEQIRAQTNSQGINLANKDALGAKKRKFKRIERSNYNEEETFYFVD